MRIRKVTGPEGAGKRDKWVAIQGRPDTDVPSPSGFPKSGTWSDLATVAMSRADVSGDEGDRHTMRYASVDTRWEMPYREDMDPELLDVPKLRRLVYRARVYDIISAAPVGRQRAITLLTTASTKSPTT